MARTAIEYGIHVFLTSLAGTVPPTLLFLVIFLSDQRASLAGIFGALIVFGLGSLLLIVLPFCFFVAVPIAILVNQFWKLTLIRTLILAIVLTGPGIVYLDYRNYQSSGPDSGPPTSPYSLTHLGESFGSPADALLMGVVPMASAILCAITLWYLRFRAPSPLASKPK